MKDVIERLHDEAATVITALPLTEADTAHFNSKHGTSEMIQRSATEYPHSCPQQRRLRRKEIKAVEQYLWIHLQFFAH